MSPVVNPLAEWRLLIKGMGGPTGNISPYTVQIVQPTNRYSRTTEGIISPVPMPRLQIQPGGPYTVAPITVPYDPEYGTGGSFWRMLDGPYPGWLLSKWTNTLSDDFGPYGQITITQAVDYDRGPGQTLATIYHPNAHVAGASLSYNSPGELHFTLLVDDPLVRIPQPKRTHYAVEFWTGSAWEEIFAGLVWDMDATDTEVVFYGIDYLGLFQYIVDERFFPTSPDKGEPTGSYYVQQSTKYVCEKLLQYAIDATDSMVGFIQLGEIAGEMDLHPLWSYSSTFSNILDAVVGLIDSHRAGTGIQTRVQVVKVGTVYRVQIVNDPGQARDDLLLQYREGGLVQGYRVIPFGEQWASRVNVIGRDLYGKKVNFETASGVADQVEWGRVTQTPVVLETKDREDLIRRAHQAAVDASAMGRKISVGLRTGSYRPLEGFDICDWVPVDINHGGVNTLEMDSHVWGQEGEDPSEMASGYWTIRGVTWESFDDGHWVTGLSLFPKNGIPYTPTAVEPDYHNHYTRGGDNYICYEIVGAEYFPLTAQDSGDLTHTGAWSSATLPSVTNVNALKKLLVLVGMAVGSKGATVNPTAGWTKDTQLEGADGGMFLYAQHRLYNAGEVTGVTPVVSYSNGNRWGGATVAYQNRAGEDLGIRQIVLSSSGVAGLNPSFVFPLQPLIGSILVAFGNNGEWFIPNNWDPAHGLTNGFSPYVGDGIINVAQGGYFASFGQYLQFQWSHRIPYYGDIGSTRPPGDDPTMDMGEGPPPPTSDPPSQQYTDTATGRVYEYNYATGQWDYVAGTGYAASGLYDFTFGASTQWVINHTMSGYPRVTIRDTGGEVIFAEIIYISIAQIVVNFSSAVAGSAHLG
jgi:hypothetical protein